MQKGNVVKKEEMRKIPESVFVHGHRLFLDRTDSLGLSKKKAYERFTTDFLSREVRPGEVVVDIGAHIGYYTLLFASLTGSSGKVHAFEPSPENFSTLKKNIAANLIENVILNPKAVSDQSGRARLFLSESNSGDHRIQSADETRESVEIETVKLDEYFQRLSDRVDWIKIDTQGADCAIIKGAEGLLKKNPHLKLLTEFWPYGLKRFSVEPEDYLKLLEGHGFKFFQPKKIAGGFVPVRPKDILEECRTRSHLNLLCMREKTYADMIKRQGGKRIFFSMRNSGAIKNYESVLFDLLAKGHKITVSFPSFHELYPQKDVQRLWGQSPGFQFEEAPFRRDFWSFLARFLRRLQNYVRYLGPDYAKALKLKQRASVGVPWLFRFLLSCWAGKGTKERLEKMTGFFQNLEKCFPVNAACLQALQEQKPDLFLATPLVDLNSEQLDWLKAAQSLGIKTCLCVHSWDNLTNKGLIQIIPDRVILWNEIQKKEAIELHHIPSEKISVTGAQCFDRWFEMKPSPKDQMVRKLGKDFNEPYLLYLCSSSFIAPDEPRFIEKWIAYLREQGPVALKDRLIVIRPHPQNMTPWQRTDLSRFASVVVFPRTGANPIDPETRQDYFDTLYYSAAVIGMNTTAMIEAGILQKPVLTVLAEEFKGGQEGTLHFSYLMEDQRLYLSRDLGEHCRQLGQALRGPMAPKGSEEFIVRFVRPYGVTQAATPLAVEALESLFLLSPKKVKRLRKIFLLIRYAVLWPLACLLKPIEGILALKKVIPKAGFLKNSKSLNP